jgi:hypothetical protein
VQQDWDQHQWVTFVQLCSRLLKGWFKLDVSQVVFSADRHRFLGAIRFRPGINGVGLRGEIQINVKRLGSTPLWQSLAELLLALLQALQQERAAQGDRNYDKAAFRRQARACGLDVEPDGSFRILRDGPFADFMADLGVSLPDGEEFSRPVGKPAGDSRSKKWSCGGCRPPVNARVAVADFQALCLKCSTRFVRQERPKGKTAAHADPADDSDSAALQSAVMALGSQKLMP